MTGKINFDEIDKIVKFIDERNLAEFEFEVEGFKIKLRKNLPPASGPAAAASVLGAPSMAPESRKPAAADFDTEGKADLHLIPSPIVGTFYRAPSPASPSFAEVGDVVKKGQTLCIVEAMKLMNEIESDVDGVVKEIFIENGKPVEYGQKLFAIAT
ncbi:MAG: acetyl-CoA carboxylase biotin carboxyl carrier protein [Candidatus Aminicenantes bacterium]|nr:acetyl-CoA carboxylase biotin carboxyl carrier protein [Candidatus Aminicenantes bacterium]